MEKENKEYWTCDSCIHKYLDMDNNYRCRRTSNGTVVKEQWGQWKVNAAECDRYSDRSGCETGKAPLTDKMDEFENLLIADLCARIPYHTFVMIDEGYNFIAADSNGGDASESHTLSSCDAYGDCAIDDGFHFDVKCVRPYLRPLESMSSDEMAELHKEHLKDESMFTECIERSKRGDNSMRGKVIPHYASDWCDRNHFDHRGLIKLGLALSAPEGMYGNKDE